MSLKHRAQATQDLFSRYAQAFRFWWPLREQIKMPSLKAHEAEFLPAALALQHAPVSPAGRWVARILMGLVLAVVIWSLLGQIDIVVTVTGKVVPSDRTKTVAAVEVAVVRALHVKNGQTVHAGDVLIELDTSESDAEHDKAHGDAQVATLQVARSKALIDAVRHSTPPRMPPRDSLAIEVTPEQWREAAGQLDSQWRDFYAKRVRFDGQIAQFAKDLPLLTQRAKDYKELLKDHDVAEHAWIEKEQARIDRAGQLSDAQNQRQALITQTIKEASDAQTDGQKLAASSAQDARRASEHSRHLSLTAPVDGTVQQLTVYTVGTAVPAAQPLMQIVPEDGTVEIEAYLENKDMGFVIEGQSAAVKIDAFEYTKYGTVDAHVTHVSHDAVVQDKPLETGDDHSVADAPRKSSLQYVVKLTLDQSNIFVDGKDMPITAGMSVSAEIRTGTRRVIEYVLSPLIRHAHEALKER